MAMEPKVLILDEPTAGLDPSGRRKILKLIADYRVRTGSTVILVSHSMEDVAALATSVSLMHRSSVVMQGTGEEVVTQGGLLKSMGLNVPQVTEIFEGLRARGLPVSDRIFTIEQGLDELLRFYGKEAVR